MKNPVQNILDEEVARMKAVLESTVLDKWIKWLADRPCGGLAGGCCCKKKKIVSVNSYATWLLCDLCQDRVCIKTLSHEVVQIATEPPNTPQTS